MDGLLSPSLTNLTSTALPSSQKLFRVASSSSVKIEEKKSIHHHSSKSSTKTAPTKSPPPSRPSPLSSSPAYIPSKPKPAVESPSLPSVVFNAVEDFINNYVDPPRPFVDPNIVLSDNFAPVDELPPTQCEVVEGSLPACLDGAYIRNGPNPQFLPRGPYHLFDGDGMLHSLRISGGRATLCSRYVKTNKYEAESLAASAVVPNLFGSFHGLTASAARGALFAARVLAGQFNPIRGIGLANTSVAFFGGRLFALGESDAPYGVRIAPDGEVETLGRHDFNGQLLFNMTAHPKIDPDSGEAFAFRVGPVPPFLTFFRFRPDGTKAADVPIFSMLRPAFLHDFAITKRYAIFNDMQIGMSPLEMVAGSGAIVAADVAKVPRIGIIPRYAKDESEMKWFEATGFNIVHAINAWEEDDGGTVAMVAPNILSVEHTLERMELIHASVEVTKVDMRTGRVWRRPVSARNLDFAVINPAYVGKKSRYVYAAIGDPMPKIKGIVKLDLEAAANGDDGTVATRIYVGGLYGGEPFFVAREPENPEADEDDGYVVSYVHDEKKGESRFLVMDAKSPELDIVAAVKLPQRVPYGFHGLFVREADLKSTWVS